MNIIFSHKIFRFIPILLMEPLFMSVGRIGKEEEMRRSEGERRWGKRRGPPFLWLSRMRDIRVFLLVRPVWTVVTNWFSVGL